MNSQRIGQSRADQVILLVGQGFGLGRLPFAPGTFGTLPGLLLAWCLWQGGESFYLVATALVLVLSIWIAKRSAQMLGVADDPRIVIDEIAGVLVALALVPPSALALVVGFCVFRLLDIAKPPPISTVERRVKGGVGIVLDDVLAGIGTNLVLQLLFRVMPLGT
ncbi:MAG TPA: phosphatidylglycerophosphatase A [Gammaproteobacteria bacterium]|nr:phosphatidylglycerophosphatase A [Arenicellales bacterium]MDP6551554.1 phosphatidylglycerophosphatase A [Arenicellales bacterium]MDP6790932.1 phosphatidylglycerophosphatase A [Arenicellales bacterium]MDP6918479.1 phosphatidylglycerophosphatase A [Arenicellales bacterium]HCX87974.1 phosphatidylglycerophosphatase A [Gammaproteobacteria bacterium]